MSTFKFNRYAKIDLTCPNCSHTWKIALGELRSGPTDCPECGLGFETSKFGQGMRDAERKLRRFGR